MAIWNDSPKPPNGAKFPSPVRPAVTAPIAPAPKGRKSRKARAAPQALSAVDEASEIAREASPRVMKRLVEIAETGIESVAVQASREVLMRSHGKPHQSVSVEHSVRATRGVPTEELLPYASERMRELVGERIDVPIGSQSQ